MSRARPRAAVPSASSCVPTADKSASKLFKPPVHLQARLVHKPCDVQEPSEEHGPATLTDGSRIRYGDMLAVLPSHINPTVNLHNHAVIVQRGTVVGVELVSARGHDRPL
jgi:D-serine deaminase-like pyridoxal phosphate-dependent protein